MAQPVFRAPEKVILESIIIQSITFESSEMQTVLEVRHSRLTLREREALSFPRAIGEIEVNDVLVGDARAHRLCLEIVNDVHVQLNGYFFTRRFLIGINLGIFKVIFSSHAYASNTSILPSLLLFVRI